LLDVPQTQEKLKRRGPSCSVLFSSFLIIAWRAELSIGDKMKIGKLSQSRLTGLNRSCSVFLFCVAAAVASPAQTFTTLVDFNGSNGSFYESSNNAVLAQGTDGNFYGTTPKGGARDYGTVFKITPTGTLTSLYSFCPLAGCSDGFDPQAGLVLGSDGNFYGTTVGLATYTVGSVFQITPGGMLTTLHTFQSNLSEGYGPLATLIEATNGNFYGTTSSNGGAGGNGSGTIFEITPQGKLTVVYVFSCPTADCPDGAQPDGSLVQAANGNFYGTTKAGGVNGGGTVFKLTPGGALTTLHSFGSKGDGADPYAGLVQAADGNFYGTTVRGGAHYGAGTVFKIGAAGNFSRVYSFCSQPHCTDGAYPYGGLVQGTDGNFYGTTPNGGAHGYGTVFQLTPEGTLTTLHSFGGGDGAFPRATLVQGTDGAFYGTTTDGGIGGIFNGNGTVFSIGVGLSPFVRANPAFGGVGASVMILGNNLTGTTSVTFNGMAAEFTVVSDTFISATVPSGATAGPIAVVTPSGTLISNVSFRVIR
jgi:uncharacterized repeat protein (TIGR03803 family)